MPEETKKPEAPKGAAPTIVSASSLTFVVLSKQWSHFPEGTVCKDTDPRLGGPANIERLMALGLIDLAPGT